MFGWSQGGPDGRSVAIARGWSTAGGSGGRPGTSTTGVASAARPGVETETTIKSNTRQAVRAEAGNGAFTRCQR